VTPVRSFCRTAIADSELAGQTIREGDIVLMLYPAANRDPAVFGATADQLDVTRHPNPHVSFGFAEHYCLGASLARLEARVVLEELACRFDAVKLAGDPIPLDSTLMNSLSVLPLVFS
jgi:cytochrome P450